jgi:hypothetical protein
MRQTSTPSTPRRPRLKRPSNMLSPPSRAECKQYSWPLAIHFRPSCLPLCLPLFCGSCSMSSLHFLYPRSLTYLCPHSLYISLLLRSTFYILLLATIMD